VKRKAWRLFYIAADGRIMAVDVRADFSTLEPGTPRALFEARVPLLTGEGHHYAVTADGQRFLANALTQELPSPITVVVNWSAESKRY
jgi:hypothetical protein